MKVIKKMPMFWFGRLYVALHVGVIAMVACFGTGTLFYKFMTESGELGFWCVLSLAFVSGVGIADVFVNDFLPPRFQLNSVKRHRHFLLMALAIGPLSMAFVIAKREDFSVLHVSLALPIIGATMLAVMDVYARGREQ